jgi:hypothetical protein
MAAFQTFQSFFLKLGTKIINLDTDALKIYLSDDAPNVAADTVKADVVEIANVNGYAGPIDINAAYALSGGIGVLTSDASETVTAAGGAVGPFRYVVLYDSTVAGGPLIGFWDYGAELTLNDTQTLTVQFGASVMTVKNP